MSAVAGTSERDTHWRCPRCDRAFKRTGQQHSCRRVALEQHLPPDHAMRPVFDHLLREVATGIGACEVISLPCCVHLSGRYDFLAVLPRRSHLEVRFSLPRAIHDPRIDRSVRTSGSMWKYHVNVATEGDVDEVLIGWLDEAYHLDAI